MLLKRLVLGIAKYVVWWRIIESTHASQYQFDLHLGDLPSRPMVWSSMGRQLDIVLG